MEVVLFKPTMARDQVRAEEAGGREESDERAMAARRRRGGRDRTGTAVPLHYRECVVVACDRAVV